MSEWTQREHHCSSKIAPSVPFAKYPISTHPQRTSSFVCFMTAFTALPCVLIMISILNRVRVSRRTACLGMILGWEGVPPQQIRSSCDWFQMLRINATSVPAQMVNIHSFRDIAYHKFVRNPMCIFLLLRADPEGAVSIRGDVGCPIPTVVLSRDENFLPEPFSKNTSHQRSPSPAAISTTPPAMSPTTDTVAPATSSTWP